MSDNIVFNAQERVKTGKGATRAVRNAGLIPAVIYGDKKEAISISLQPSEINKHLNSESFFSNIYEIKVDAKKEETIVKDIQFHPVSDSVLHIDFMRINKNTEVNVEVPIHFAGEEVSPGLKRGGILNVIRHTIEVVCKPADIPEYFEIDLSETQIGDTVKFSSISVPEGVKPAIDDRDFTIASITGKGAQEETTEEGSEEGSEEGAADENAES